MYTFFPPSTKAFIGLGDFLLLGFANLQVDTREWALEELTNLPYLFFRFLRQGRNKQAVNLISSEGTALVADKRLEQVQYVFALVGFAKIR